MARVNVTSSGGGSGAVSSVAGRTGAVVLTAADVGAGQLPSGVLLPSGVVIPSGADISGVLGATSATAAAGNDSRITGAAQKASNLSDLADAPTARTNLGLGSLATKSTVASADITDGTIVSADLSATAGITSGQLAGSIAPSKITGTAVTAADTGTVTSAMIADGTIVGGDLSAAIVLPSGATVTTQSASDSSTKPASTAYVKAQIALGSDRPPANQGIYGKSTSGPSGQATGITALKPIFLPIDLYGMPSFALSQIGMRVQTLLAASTIGAAVYSATYASSAHVSATLVAQLNATLSGAASAMVQGAVTTGAAGSGASVVTLDFTTTRYLIGFMASDVATLKTWGITIPSPMTGMGIISWTGTARSSVTDWPSSFTEAANVAAISASTTMPIIDLLTATGAFYL